MPLWKDAPPETTPSPGLRDSIVEAVGITKALIDPMTSIAARLVTGDERVKVAFASSRARFNQADGSHQTIGGGRYDPNPQVLVTTDRMLIAYYRRGAFTEKQGHLEFVECPLTALGPVSSVHSGRFEVGMTAGETAQFVFQLWALQLSRIRTLREAIAGLGKVTGGG